MWRGILPLTTLSALLPPGSPSDFMHMHASPAAAPDNHLWAYTDCIVTLALGCSLLLSCSLNLRQLYSPEVQVTLFYTAWVAIASTLHTAY